MRLGELNWMEIEAYLKKDNRIMLVIGSTEQHGYLSLMTDVKVPLAMADAASLQSGVLIAPPVNFGNSPYFMAYPGTISIRLETLCNLIEDIIRSLYAHGFRRILILNGHGGNTPVQNRMHEIIEELPDLKIAWYSWWISQAVTAVAEAHGLHANHANWIEAFPFVRSTAIPPSVKDPLGTSRILNPKQAKEFYGDGVFGGPYVADEAVMNEVFSAALKEIMRMLEVL
ncbi:MAG: creatininase family protein [Anaerolineaceae bacterium]